MNQKGEERRRRRESEKVARAVGTGLGRVGPVTWSRVLPPNTLLRPLLHHLHLVPSSPVAFLRWGRCIVHFLYISNPLFFVFILSPWRLFGITSLKFLAEVSRSPFQTECHKCSTLSGNTFSAHYVGALPSPIRDVAILPSDVMSPGVPSLPLSRVWIPYRGLSHARTSMNGAGRPYVLSSVICGH